MTVGSVLAHFRHDQTVTESLSSQDTKVEPIFKKNNQCFASRTSPFGGYEFGYCKGRCREILPKSLCLQRLIDILSKSYNPSTYWRYWAASRCWVRGYVYLLDSSDARAKSLRRIQALLMAKTWAKSAAATVAQQCELRNVLSMASQHIEEPHS